MLHGTPTTDTITTYRPPFEEFELQCAKVAAGTTVHLPANQGPTIVLVRQGEGRAQALAQIKASELVSEAEVHRGEGYTALNLF